MDDEPTPITQELRGKAGQVCAKCGKLKHVRLFRRVLTAAQAAARGYFDHDTKPMHVPSKFCTECQPRPRPKDLRHMPEKALHNELANQRVKPQIVAAEIARRGAIQPVSAQEHGAAGGAARWEKFHRARWEHAKGRIRDELARMRAQTAYYQGKLSGQGAEYFGAHYEAVLAFNRACSHALRELRAQATGFVLRGRASDETLTWRRWLTPVVQDELLALWAAIPEPDDDTLRAAFGKRAGAKTFKSRLVTPMAIDASDERKVFHKCTVQTRYEKDTAAEDRLRTVSQRHARRNNG